MEMAQRHIVQTLGKAVSAHLSQGAHVEFTYPVPLQGLAAGGEQVPHADQWQLGIE